MVEALAALSNAVVPISRHDVSTCILTARSPCWRRHREGFSEVMGDVRPCQDARTAPCLGTLVGRLCLCRQRVLSAACLAPPIGTYTLFQPIKVNKHHSMPNHSFLPFQITQARVFGGTVP